MRDQHCDHNPLIKAANRDPKFRLPRGATLLAFLLFADAAYGQSAASNTIDAAARVSEEKFEKRVIILADELSKISPCRIVELNRILKGLEADRDEASSAWVSVYTDLRESEERAGKWIEEDLAQLPAAIAKLDSRLKQVVTDLEDANRRLGQLSQTESATPQGAALAEAKRKLINLQSTLTVERSELETRRTEVTEGKGILVIQSQSVKDVKAMFESLKSRKQIKFDTFYDLGKLKIRTRRAECRGFQ